MVWKFFILTKLKKGAKMDHSSYCQKLHEFFEQFPDRFQCHILPPNRIQIKNSIGGRNCVVLVLNLTEMTIDISLIDKCLATGNEIVANVLKFAKLNGFRKCSLLDESTIEIDFATEDGTKLSHEGLFLSLKQIELLVNAQTWYGKFGFKSKLFTENGILPKINAEIHKPYIESIATLIAKLSSIGYSDIHSVQQFFDSKLTQFSTVGMFNEMDPIKEIVSKLKSFLKQNSSAVYPIADKPRILVIADFIDITMKLVILNIEDFDEIINVFKYADELMMKYIYPEVEFELDMKDIDIDAAGKLVLRGGRKRAAKTKRRRQRQRRRKQRTAKFVSFF
jgi:hypothetical protein